MGTLTDEAVPRRIVEAIKQETGRPPPRIIADVIYSYRKTWKRQDLIVYINYSNSVPLIKASIDNKSVQVNGRDILSKDQCDTTIYSYDEMKRLAGKKLKAVAFEHDGLQVIICYYDDSAEHQAVVVLVDSSTKHVLWHELLYGGGNYSGFRSGVDLPRKYYCDITSKYICIYGDGPTGGVFIELYDR